MRRILIAEDETGIATFVEAGLTEAGFETKIATDGLQAYRLAETESFDLLILDIGLPVMDGLAVLRQLRNDGVHLPVIILSARDSVQDKVAGLSSGADDYLAKPFALEELVARVHSRLRPAYPVESEVLVAGDLVLDGGTQRARLHGREVALSAREFALAQEFVRHAGQVLSRDQLLANVWGFDFDPGSNVVGVYVQYLRTKLGEHRIETIRGLGYRFAEP
ncbi:response regulator transcription factor [Specibacter sp. NPDC057265]|uniref:response regulator transcription factor n=1 Tax=Specibacter sp. NPDC057265 TaxID=3346075 RepID=UPI00362C32A3